MVSKNALWDSITALDWLACFCYGITAFACVWYFRREAFKSMSAFLMKILMPGLGGILLFTIFIKTTISSLDPSFGSGNEIFGIGLVFIMGAGVLALGVVTMVVMAFSHRPFFRGDVLKKGTPLLQLEKPAIQNPR